MKAPSPLLILLCLTLVSDLCSTEPPSAPDWAQPGSATHQQIPPPKDFRRASTTTLLPLGLFEGRTDVGSALVPGSASFNPENGSYTLHSAGYNIWYHRDEFHFLWKKMSGDVFLAADVSFPNKQGYFDRKVVLIVRQDLEDDAKEIMTGLHGAGLLHLAQRPEKGADLKEDARLEMTAKQPVIEPLRIGLEKHGNRFRLLVGGKGEALRQVGEPVTLTFEKPFYVGIGFTSHLPVTSDSALVENLVFEDRTGKAHGEGTSSR